MNLFFYDRGVAEQLERIFTDDVQVSRPVTYEAWKQRGLAARLLEILALPIRDLL
jgi:hypothetical protein